MTSRHLPADSAVKNHLEDHRVFPEKEYMLMGNLITIEINRNCGKYNLTQRNVR